MKFTTTCLAIVLFCSVAVNAQSVAAEKSLSLSIEINAPVDSVWARWSSAAGLQKFFAPVVRFEPGTLGLMEVHFAPDAPAGQRGSENNRILAMQEKQMLSFTWDAPPIFPEIRKQRTVVLLRFFEITPGKTLVVFRQMGWGTGADWEAVFNYFLPAWRDRVLPYLKYSLEVRPIDWKNFPASAPVGLSPANLLKN
ncbi:MAG: SRPBCC family protein [Bacteroidota bacterium]